MNGIVIKEEIKGDVVILRMSGNLDAITSPSSECKIFEFINQGKNKVLIDLSGVQHLSSAGLRVFVSVTRKLRSMSGNLVLVAPSLFLMDILKISGCQQVLEIANTLEEGLRRF